MSVAEPLAWREPRVHERFEALAQSAPAATALRFRGAELSYGELNSVANRLARHLRERGVEREARVVVCVEPSFDIAVALLALLKLGAVYVPLDPSYPMARVTAILADTKPRLVLTQHGLTQKLAFAGSEVVELDRAGAELSAQSSADLGVFIDPAQAATVFYTSGTTGTPKGVVATHRNLTSYLDSARQRYDFSAADAGVALARFSFSISLFELLSPLTAGGSLLLLERRQILDFSQLADALSEVTFFHAGPSLMRGLLGHLERHRPGSARFARLRHASSGGDMVPVDVLERLLRAFPSAEVFVIYGSSEISCMGTTYAVPRDEPLTRTYVGRAFAGTTLRVVDDELRDVPAGVVGEVLFAGPGVVKGYLNRPELTAEKFIERDGMRFYRTGDRGRTNEEGLLELVGRADFQVKIGGIRVELGEIEHHLRRAPGVSNGVVTAKTLAGETLLVAYIVADEHDQRSSHARQRAIREFLAEQLPDYMVPAHYVELPALPLNHNLKVDRRALPDPLPTPGDEAETTLARLARICRELLGAARVEPHDNFFELGGTSLAALQFVSEVERQLGVSLSGLEVLREPLGVLARLCDSRAGRTPDAPKSAAVRAPVFEPFFFGPEAELYGVLHGAPASETAVLLCAPLGHEWLRAHFVLQQLARRLAERGAACLRFDYYGAGDSQGEPERATLSRFRADIVTAYQELRRRTGATQILGVGARLGASLLASAARELDFGRLVLWDPIQSGEAYRAELVAAQCRYERASPLGSWRQRLGLRLRRHGRDGDELLGTRYSPATLRELSELRLELPRRCPQHTLQSESAWLDLAQLEDMLPDTDIARRLSELLGYP